jgi:hypothetical protein
LAAPATVSGVVRDVAGVPQMGAQVELLRADLSVASVVVSDSKGRYQFASVVPGRYALKAVCQSFLPTLRENVRVHTGTVVNLTMSTLYEAIQWLPSEPRKSSAQKDDWVWTLRSAANRPLLRWLEDGPLVVVEGNKGSARRLKARLVASGQDGSFGESGERFSAMVEDTPPGSRELLARVDFAPNSDAGMESMLGFRQELGYVGAVQTVATVSVHPEIEGPNGQGFNAAALRSEETIHLGDLAEVEAGATAMMARMAGAGSVRATLPSLEVRWRNGDKQAFSYRLATQVPLARVEQSETTLPRFALRQGRLAMERGLHQELGWERTTENSGVRVAVFADRLRNPVVEGRGDASSDALLSDALLDRSSGLMRTAGEDFSTTGVEASIERQIGDGNRVRLSYANGDALVMPAAQPRQVNVAQLMAAARPHRTQTYAITLSGTLEGSGTRWRASYRWQPEDAVTTVAPYALNAASPYLNLRLRQPVRIGTSNFDALFDVQNLLAQGYRPYLLTDGSVLLFAQGQRAIRAGLAFTF